METKRRGATPWKNETSRERTELLLSLPRRAVLGGLDVARLARAQGDPRRAAELEHRFGMRSHEHAFVRAVLERAPQLWVFRADQRGACGDLVIVDMSARRAARTAVVLELKQRTPVRERPRHRQLAHHAEAVAELVRRGVLGEEVATRVLVGGVGVREVLEAHRALRPGAGPRS